MAEEAEGREHGTAAAGPGVDPVAVSLALGAVAQSERVAAKAEAFLEKQGALSDRQSRLADLQIDTLQKKDEFELSHLRFRHFSDYARFALEIAGFLVVFLIVSGLATMVWSAMEDRDTVFDAFSVPSDVAQTGMTGAVLANRVLDRFDSMQVETHGVTQVASSGRRNQADDTRVEIPDTGISLSELARYLRAWLGHEVHVTGDLVHTAKGFAMTVRYGSQPSVTLQRASGDLEALIQMSAERIFAAARPYRFADYLVRKQRYAEAESMVPPLTVQGSAEDRALAYSAWAEIEFFQGNMGAALDKGREAVRFNPQTPLTHLWLGATEGNVGHEEASWSSMSEGVRLFDPDGAACIAVGCQSVNLGVSIRSRP